MLIISLTYYFNIPIFIFKSLRLFLHPNFSPFHTFLSIPLSAGDAPVIQLPREEDTAEEW